MLRLRSSASPILSGRSLRDPPLRALRDGIRDQRLCRWDKTVAAATDGTGDAARNVVSDEDDHTSCGDSRTRVGESENSFSPGDSRLGRQANPFGNTVATAL